MATEQKKGKMTLKQLFDGDMLLNLFLSKHMGLIALIAGLVIVYVSNRYAFQLEQIEIEELRKELDDVKYNALARSSELMEKSRESNIQKFITEQGSDLNVSANAPVVIKK